MLLKKYTVGLNNKIIVFHFAIINFENTQSACCRIIFYVHSEHVVLHETSAWKIYNNMDIWI